METEVKLQLMESALEAVSLHNMTDTTSLPAPPPPPLPAMLVSRMDSSTSTVDLLPVQDQNKDQDPPEATTREDSNISTNNDSETETLALQLEVRKLRHQLIISQITAKQFKSECLLYKTQATGSMTVLNKKRKEFCASPGSKGPSKQCLRTSTPAPPPASAALSSSARTTAAALKSIENRRPRCQPTVGGVTGRESSLHKKELLHKGNTRERRGGHNAAYSVNMIDGSDMFHNICLRM